MGASRFVYVDVEVITKETEKAFLCRIDGEDVTRTTTKRATNNLSWASPSSSRTRRASSRSRGADKHSQE
jgi:hypothetical protein